MDPITLAIIGGALGLGKGAGNSSAASAQNRLNAETARYSPWTKMQPGEFKTSNLIGDILGGAGSGLALGQMAALLGGGGALGAGAGGGGGANLWAGMDGTNFLNAPVPTFKGFR